MKELLASLIEEFRNNFPREDDCVPRSHGFFEKDQWIKVAIGMRRTGKTYLIYQKIRELLSQGIHQNQILFVNFEDERLLPMRQKDLSQLLDAFYEIYPENHHKPCYFFLDEIQNVDDWLLVIRRFFDTKKLQIYLTGSSAKLLSKEIATSLRGRSIATEVFPYSFKEYCLANKHEIPSKPFGKIAMDYFLKYFENYQLVGGFPGVQGFEINERRTILQNYVDSVIFRDIVDRYKIRETTLIKYLIKTLIKNVASPFSVNKFHKDIHSQGFKASKETLYQYVEYVEDSFLMMSSSLFSESIRKKQSNPKKVYIVDNGLVSARQIGRNKNFGPLFENQIFLDLRREGKKVSYYLTQKGGYEIDFVVENTDGSLELLQAVYDASDEQTLDREQKALEQAEKELGIKGRMITPKDYVENFLQSQ